MDPRVQFIGIHIGEDAITSTSMKLGGHPIGIGGRSLDFDDVARSIRAAYDDVQLSGYQQYVGISIAGIPDAIGTYRNTSGSHRWRLSQGKLNVIPAPTDMQPCGILLAAGLHVPVHPENRQLLAGQRRSVAGAALGIVYLGTSHITTVVRRSSSSRSEHLPTYTGDHLWTPPADMELPTSSQEVLLQELSVADVVVNARPQPLLSRLSAEARVAALSQLVRQFICEHMGVEAIVLLGENNQLLQELRATPALQRELANRLLQPQRNYGLSTKLSQVAVLTWPQPPLGPYLTGALAKAQDLYLRSGANATM